MVTIPAVVPDDVEHQNAHNDTSNIAHGEEDSQEDLITIRTLDQADNTPQNQQNQNSPSTTDCMDQTVHKIPPDPPS